jgi:hypothetical protein
MPRGTVQGLLSISCGFDGTLPEINIPKDEAAFQYSLCAARDWWPFVRSQDPPKPGVALEIRPSDKGRYLTALLRMSGGIHRAQQIFLSKFWKEQFEALGATPKVTDARIDEVKQLLQKRFRGGQIATDDEWTRLAQTVLTAARAARLPARYRRFDRLTKAFEEFRNVYWNEHEAGAPRDEWDEEEQRSLALSIRYLCQREILHQGHEWRCRQCFNNNWVSIDDLTRVMTCEVCGNTQSAPVADPWHFKLNGFVLEGLREHGLLPAIWCLAKCARHANESFFYLESHELFFSEPSVTKGEADAELDLLIVSDGMVRLCKAKTSGQNIDVPKIAELARRVRPDVVTLAVMEPRSTALTQRLAELQERLQGSDIAADLMVLESGDIDD